jgi:hypothetical protein
MAFKTVGVRSLLAAAVLLSTAHAFADDAPVEKPAVDRPALPQPSANGPAGSGSAQSSGRSSTQNEAPRHSKEASSAHSSGGAQASGSPGSRAFPYFAAGPAVLIGLSGGQDFERTNPALTGGLGVEIPVARGTGLGFELNGDVELAAQADRGTYTALLLRARLGHLFTPRNRLWGAIGLGGAGYQSTSLAFGLAAGTSLMLVPKFGIDLSANLDLLGASSSHLGAVQNDYPGGAVLLIAVRALFELHR